MKTLRQVLTAFALMLAMIAPAAAYNPDEVLDDPALEARARSLSLEFRCLVCQNQSIDDSNAELARDLRLLVRERLVAGDSDEEVISYVVSRYGEFVLLKPRFSMQTLLLWGAPAAILVIGAAVMVMNGRSRSRAAAASPGNDALSTAERAELAKLLKDREQHS
ncbi:cytochrome c-type biogenesis protein [Hoeflea sp.]|uniref:cytochrome c-type biogenesis protein n=1 Tax=Hoeflea sp. TaxID=1940281 RepID=UPI0019B14180|nr:cytochrome c-type biogenesis protein [Hoeflea sp.]MBC7279862.1 cytochrome c-type biogenesis protein CcmH [Hoeflea sp.]